MALAKGGTNDPFSFCAAANAGTILTGFNIGGTNTLQAFAAGGGTVFGVTGSVNFSQTPEPATVVSSSGIASDRGVAFSPRPRLTLSSGKRD